MGREFPAARLALQRSIELDANFQAALNDLSVLETGAGRLDQAFYWAKRGFPLAPNLAKTYYHLAVPLMLLDDVSAERWLRAGVARFPINSRSGGVHRLQILLAIIELTRGQPAAALERIRNAVTALPKNGEIQTFLTELIFLTDAAETRDRIDTALKEAPEARFGYSGYTVRTLRAFLWLKSGDREHALPLIDAALKTNRSDIAAGDRTSHPLYENAALQLMRGDRAAALDGLEKTSHTGFTDTAFIKVDPLIAPLANEPRFLQVVDRISRDKREMRQRVDFREIDEWTKAGPR